MAKGTKPGEKPEEQEAVAPPKKSKKKLIIIVALVVVVSAAAIAAWLLLKPAHPRQGENAGAEAASTEHPEEAAKLPPKFIEIGTYTTNLAPDEGDRFVQTAITFKISKPELEEKISATKPELQHRINMLLQSKLPSELSTSEGKRLLAAQIKAQAEEVLGLSKSAPTIGAEPEAGHTKNTKTEAGLDEVLFTSFLIQ